MKPLGAAGMQAVINPAGVRRYSAQISIVSQCRSINASVSRKPQFFCCKPPKLTMHNGERAYLNDRSGGRGSAAGLLVLQILPLSEYCETRLNSEETLNSYRPPCWATRFPRTTLSTSSQPCGLRIKLLVVAMISGALHRLRELRAPVYPTTMWRNNDGQVGNWLETGRRTRAHDCLR